MIMDFGHSYTRRYWMAVDQFTWINGSPGGGSAPEPEVTTKRFRGMTKNINRLISPM